MTMPRLFAILSATMPLVPQLAAAGDKPSDITCFALSHDHSDHTANANRFAGATWIEHDIAAHEKLPKSPGCVE